MPTSLDLQISKLQVYLIQNFLLGPIEPHLNFSVQVYHILLSMRIPFVLYIYSVRHENTSASIALTLSEKNAFYDGRLDGRRSDGNSSADTDS